MHFRKEVCKCIVCGINFHPSQNSSGRYCDRRCYYRGMVKAKIVKCFACKKELKRQPNQLKKNRVSVCSGSCGGFAREVLGPIMAS